MKRRTIIGVVLVLCCGMAACGGMAPKSKSLSLSDSIRMFNDSLRWNRYQAAGKFVVPMDRGNFIRDQQNAGESRRIVEYKLVEILMEDPKTAGVIVQWSVTSTDSPVVQKERILQSWTQVGTEWFLLRIAEAENAETGGKPAGKDKVQ